MTWPQYRRRVVWVDGREVRLTRSGMELFAILFMRRGQWIAFEELIPLLYPDPDLEPDWARGCLWRFHHQIRRALGPVTISSRNRGIMIPLPEIRSEMAIAA